MNEQGVDVALADCLARIGAGELTIDGCLTLYPNVEGLAEQLHVALTVKAVPPPTPDEAWFSASRKRLEDAVRPKPHSANLLFAIAPVGVLAWAWNRSGFWAPPAWTRSAALRAVTAMTVMTAASSGAAVAAGESLPGSALYSVKLATEDARLAASFDPTQRALLHLEFARNRFGEMRTIKSETTQPPPAELAAAAQTQIQAAARELGPAAVPEYSPKTAPLLAALTGREIEFRGAVQRLDAEMIQVSGAQVRVSRETAVTGAPAADAQVVVQAKLGLDGAYHALSIRVLPPQAPPEQRVSAPMPSAGPAQVNAAPAVAPAAAPRPAASAAQQGAALTAPTIAAPQAPGGDVPRTGSDGNGRAARTGSVPAPKLDDTRGASSTAHLPGTGPTLPTLPETPRPASPVAATPTPTPASATPLPKSSGDARDENGRESSGAGGSGKNDRNQTDEPSARDDEHRRGDGGDKGGAPGKPATVEEKPAVSPPSQTSDAMNEGPAQAAKDGPGGRGPAPYSDDENRRRSRDNNDRDGRSSATPTAQPGREPASDRTSEKPKADSETPKIDSETPKADAKRTSTPRGTPDPTPDSGQKAAPTRGGAGDQPAKPTADPDKTSAGSAHGDGNDNSPSKPRGDAPQGGGAPAKPTATPTTTPSPERTARGENRGRDTASDKEGERQPRDADAAHGRDNGKGTSTNNSGATEGKAKGNAPESKSGHRDDNEKDKGHR